MVNWRFLGKFWAQRVLRLGKFSIFEKMGLGHHLSLGGNNLMLVGKFHRSPQGMGVFAGGSIVFPKVRPLVCKTATWGRVCRGAKTSWGGALGATPPFSGGMRDPPRE